MLCSYSIFPFYSTLTISTWVCLKGYVLKWVYTWFSMRLFSYLWLGEIVHVIILSRWSHFHMCLTQWCLGRFSMCYKREIYCRISVLLDSLSLGDVEYRRCSRWESLFAGRSEAPLDRHWITGKSLCVCAALNLRQCWKVFFFVFLLDRAKGSVFSHDRWSADSTIGGRWLFVVLWEVFLFWKTL